MIEDPQGTYVSYEDYAYLKTNLEYAETMKNNWMCKYAKEAEQVKILRSLDSLKTVSLTDSVNWNTIGAYDEAKQEVERLRSVAQDNKAECEATRIENARLKDEVKRLTERLGGVRLIVTEDMYDELYQKHIKQEQELRNIALTAKQILDENTELKANAENQSKQSAHICASEDTRAEKDNLNAEAERLRNVEFAIGVIRNILGDHLGRHYYYKVDYAMRGETLKTHE